MSSSSARIRIAVAAACGAAALVAAPSAAAAPSWYDGVVQNSTITNCASIIGGYPYAEQGAGTYAGYYADPASLPGVGQTFYTHVVVGGLGNACSGQQVHLEIKLPSGLSLAITGATPVFCWYINFTNSTDQRETTACPQSGQATAYGYGPSFDAVNPSQTWPLPQGRGWELQIPVKSNRVLNGGFGACADCIGFAVKLLDGNSSPILLPHQGLFVQAAGGAGALPGGSGGKGDATPVAPTAKKKCKKGRKLKKGKCVKRKKKR